MNKYIIATLIVLAFISSLYSDIFTIIEEQEDYVIVKFELTAYEIETVEIDNELFSDIRIEEAAYLSREGYPQLPFFSGVMGLPPGGELRISLLSKKQKTLDDIDILPVNKRNYLSNNIEYVFSKNEEAYSMKEAYPGELISSGEAAYLGDRYFEPFLIHPFQYRASRRELTITSELIARFDIIGDKTTNRFGPTSGFMSDIGDEFFLNNSTSRNWRKEKEKTEFEYERQSEDVDGIQLIVSERGIYRITLEDLITGLEEFSLANDIEFQLGYDWEMIDPRYLELNDEFGPVPLYFKGETDGSFDPEDYFEFFGDIHYGDESYFDEYSSENYYTLSMSNNYGSRMAVENGGLELTNPNLFIVPDSYTYTVHFEKQNIVDHLGAQFVFTSSSFYKEDIWFWSKIMAPDLAIFPFEIQYPKESSFRSFNARVSLFGLTYNPDDYDNINHHAIVRVNSSIINNIQWYGQNEQIFENQQSIPNSYLHHGENNLYVSLPGLPGNLIEQVLLDYFELTYWREYRTDDDILEFSKPQNRPPGMYQFELKNFQTDSLTVYKIGSSIFENVQIETFIDEEEEESDSTTFKLTFQDEVLSDEIKYIAVSDQNKLKPIMIRPDLPSSLKDSSNQADYIIITAENYIDNEGTMEFESIWESQGHQVEIISIQDIYDEFNFGMESAESIRDFLSYAYNNWQEPEVGHVLLLGDGIIDERDNSVDRRYNIIPFRRVWEDDRGAIASDNWLACIVGTDPVPDISISRVNVWNQDQIPEVVEKTEEYLSEPRYDDLWHSRVVLAAGGNPSEGSSFARQCERIRNFHIPADFHITRVYCNVDELPQNYYGNTTSLLNEINSGTSLVMFVGHGGGHVWADYNLLNKSDVATMNNDNYPFVASMSCFGSAFNYAQSSCIGEELVLKADRGAIGHVGFTGYGYVSGDELFAKHILDGIYELQLGSIGDVIRYTKAKFYTSYLTGTVGIALTHGCALLGDPMIPIVLPQSGTPINLNGYNLSISDTLRINAAVGPDIERGKFVIYDENDVQLPLDEYYPLELPVINDTLWSTDFVISPLNEPIMSRSIKVFAYGDEKEITGITGFTVGQTAVINVKTIPEIPTAVDPVNIKADFFDEQGIASISCIVEETDFIPMVSNGENNYITETPYSPQYPGAQVEFRFLIHDSEGDSTFTDDYFYHVVGPDLFLQQCELTQIDHAPMIKVHLSNIGPIDALGTTLKIYKNQVVPQLITEIDIDPLESQAWRWEYIELPLLNGTYQFVVYVNQNGGSFAETSYINNRVYSDTFNINMFMVGSEYTVSSSLDDNLVCYFPAGLFSEETIGFINQLEQLQAYNQPDIETILMADSTFSKPYEIGIYNQELYADTLGHFPNGEKITLEFNYSAHDSLTQEMESEGNFKFYRWEEDYQKWIHRGGYMILEEDKVVFLSDRAGIYSVFRNLDEVPPSIEFNVEDQEFTNGSYISKNGVLSVLLSDANGIDVFSNSIYLEIDGYIIGQDDLILTLQNDNLINIPVKYELGQLDLDDGDHHLNIGCTDVNGNFSSRDVDFMVSTDFDIIRLSNYPNPVSSNTIDPNNISRTRFIYILTDDAEEVYLKVYTVSGRLVKTFRNLPSSVGYHEFPRSTLGWNCRDENGMSLANGVYFYRITAKKGNKKIEKTQKMAILN